MPTVQFADHVLEHDAADAALEWHLGWHFDRLPATAEPPDLRIRLGGCTVAVPEARTPSMMDGPLLRWDLRDRLLLRHETGVTARVDDEMIEIDASRLDSADWRPSRQLIFSALSWWLERRGTVLLHGGLVGRDGEASLVLGGTGTGKSSIVAAALAHGWSVFSDDLVAVRTTTGGVEVTGLPKRLMVDPELAAELPVQGTQVLVDVRSRVVLPPSTLAVGSARLRGLVVAAHDDGGGSLDPVDHGDALQVVLTSSLETPRPEVLRRQLGVLAAVAGRPAHRLAHAHDAERRLTVAARLLARAWQEQGRAAEA